MIIGFSTSSSFSSVACFDLHGKLLCSTRRESQSRASEACLLGLSELGVDIREGTAFLADIGPGSFTGTRVGVVLAKTFAWINQVHCGGTSAFDLISRDRTVVFPSKKGEWFVRQPKCEVRRQEDLPSGDYLGFGPGIESPVYPDAVRFGLLMGEIELVPPTEFLPKYLIEPSISLPKQPFKVNP